MSVSDGISSVGQQPVVITMMNGTNLVLTIDDLDSFNSYNVQICLNYGAQIGGTIITLMFVLILTTSNRRHTPVFSLNILALLLNFIRLLFAAYYYTGPLGEPYVYFTGAIGLVGVPQYSLQVAAVLIALLMLTVIEVCLVIQIKAVIATLPIFYRTGVLGISVLIAAAALGLRVAYSVVNIKAIVLAANSFEFADLTAAVVVLTTVSICWFCLVFTCELGRALLRRHKMGIKSFGPIDILLLMGGQTMLVPSLFCIAQFAPIQVPDLQSNILTVTAIFLPMSSLWAGSLTSSRQQQAIAFVTPLRDGTMPRFGSSCRDLFGFKTLLSKLSSSRNSRARFSSDKGAAHTTLSHALPDLERQGF